MPHPTLKAELAAMIAEADRKHLADLYVYHSDEWWGLTQAEAEVFAIEPADWPRMMLTLYCFEAYTGESGTPEFSGELVTAARAEFPQWLPNPAWSSWSARQDAFLSFAREFAGLPHRDAFATIRKLDAHNARVGLMRFADGS